MKIAIFDARPYDQNSFTRANRQFRHKLTFFDQALTLKTVDLAAGHQAVCGFVNTVGSEAVLRKLAALGIKVWLQRSMGYEQIDLAAAQKLGLAVFRVANYSAESVAEHALTLMLAVNRKLPLAKARNSKWNFSLVGLQALMVKDAVVGIVGAGKIGLSLIKILNAMGARTLVFDQYARKNFPEHAGDYGFTYVSFNRLLTQASFISLHAPLTEATYHMFDREVFKKVRPGLILVNCARGELVKTKDLVWALKKGILGGAGLDVLERERDRFFCDLQTKAKRLAKEDPDWNYLLQAENVILTAHQAYFTSAALDQIALLTLQNASAAEKGEFSQALVLKSDGTVING